MIETRELTRTFAGAVAVDRLTLSVGGSGVVGLLGPNGAGKTTTLRMLAGALAPTAGSARVAGHDVAEEPEEVQARVGYLPEVPPLYPDLTVGEHLAAVAGLRGIPRPASAAGRALERAGLLGWERRRAGGLSRGYRQRLGLAMAIVHEPRLLILDEPTAGLDPAQVVEVRGLVRELARERLVLLSTHALPDVEALCGRALVLRRGRLVADDSLAGLAERAEAAGGVELAVDEPSEDLRPALAALPEARSVERTGAGRYLLRGGPGLEPAVAALVAARGVGLRALHRRPASLEAAFLALVGEDR